MNRNHLAIVGRLLFSTPSFSGWLCDGTMFSAMPESAEPVPVEGSLVPEGKLDGAPLASAKIRVDATTCRRFTATLPAPAARQGRYFPRADAGEVLGTRQRNLPPHGRDHLCASERGVFAGNEEGGSRHQDHHDVSENAPSPITLATAELKHDGRTVSLKAKPYSATAIRIRIG